MGRREERRKRAEEQERKDKSGIAKSGRTGTKGKEQRPSPKEREQKGPHRRTRTARMTRKTGPKNTTPGQEGRPQAKSQASAKQKTRQRQAHHPNKDTHPGAWQLPQTKQQTKQQNKQQTLLLPPQLHSALRASLRCDVNYSRPWQGGLHAYFIFFFPDPPPPPFGGVGGEDKVTNKTKTMNLNISPPCLPQLVNKKKKKYITKQHDNKTTHKLQANLRANHRHS